MTDVRDIQPSKPIEPIRRRWRAPDESNKEKRRRDESPVRPSPDETPDGHIDEYV